MGVPEEANRPNSVVRVRQGEHSAKPEECHGIIDRMYPGLPKPGLFCGGRLEREGQSTWGNESVA